METYRGKLVLNGMFVVPHKEQSDRLIFDRRPSSALDERMRWARLPLGAQLVQLVGPPGEVARGSGDDLKTYFYVLSNLPEATAHNAVSRESLWHPAQQRRP